MMEPLPSINKAYGLVLQQEGQLQGATTPESKILNTASTQPNPTIKVIGDKGTMQVEEMGEVVALMLLARAEVTTTHPNSAHSVINLVIQ